MSSLPVVAGTIGIAVAAVTHGLWVGSIAPEPAPEVIYGAETLRISEPYVPDEWPVADRSDSRRVDRFGNQIETAAGDYRIDGRGEVYERHAPDTALPNLPPPGV